MKSPSYCLACLALVLLLPGCVNLEPKPDPTRHFALGPSAKLANSPSQEKPFYIQRPDLPAYAMGNRFMVRADSGEVRTLHGARWAEAMSEGLARALGEWLASESGRNISGYYPWPALESEALSLKVQFIQLLATDSGEILITADWRVKDDERVLAEGRYQASGISWQPGQAGTMVEGINQALRKISEAVAAAL